MALRRRAACSALCGDPTCPAFPCHPCETSALPLCVRVAWAAGARCYTPCRPTVQRLLRMAVWGDDDVSRGANLSIAEPPPEGMRAGDATLHLGWTLHGAQGNACAQDRPAIAITYFADGARVHRSVLRMARSDGRRPQAGADAGAAGAPEPGDERAIRLSTADGGSELLVRLLTDDAGTWMRWLRASPPVLIPGMPVKDAALAPLLFASPATAAAPSAGSSRRPATGQEGARKGPHEPSARPPHAEL